MSELTIGRQFFDELWPLILDYNQCDIKSRNTTPFFEPLQQFDYVWAHELLAARRYKNYTKPFELNCCAAKPDEATQSQTCGRADDETEVWRKPKVTPLDEQINAIQNAKYQRQKLLHAFSNRKFPWYIQRPNWDAEFKITDSVRTEFVNDFEVNILRNIFTFQCKLIIIDAGADVDLKDLERWLKFCRYVQILVVVRCKVLERRLKLLRGIFHTLLLQENLENTWHEELKDALRSSFYYARKQGWTKDCATPFIFVFSQKRGMSTCDTYKILQKF